MEKLRLKHISSIQNTNLDFVRDYINEFPWSENLLGIKGSRGVGKTTLLLQYIKKNYNLSEKALYISLDDLYFTENKLTDLVDDFVSNGGEHLFLDEVHKYPNWAIELKNIYDYHKHLRVVFTGSSMLEILNSRADLSRRAVVFNMQGLSFREYLSFEKNINFSKLKLEDILNDHTSIVLPVIDKIKPLKQFQKYLKKGYFPFSKENPDLYYHKVNEVVNMIIEIEIPLMRGLDNTKVNKIKQLLYIISQSVPFKPNITKLAERIGISRNLLLSYIRGLDDANLINLLNKDMFGLSALQKPEKIYLENTNLSYVLADEGANIGNIRETFFLNQLSKDHVVTYSSSADFFINNKYTFEVGGKSKSGKQIKGIKNSFIVSDDIEMGYENKIPLWIFGFLY
jgi:predicted AAA+ superfamily ATPase